MEVNFLFNKNELVNDENIKNAIKEIMTFDADMRGTQIKIHLYQLKIVF